MVYSIHYIGLPKSVSEEDIKSIFKEAGTVLSCTKIESKHETIRGLKECQLAVLKYDGYIYDKDYPITVKLSNKTQALGIQLNNGYKNNVGKAEMGANSKFLTSKAGAPSKVAQQNKVESNEKLTVKQVTSHVKDKPKISTQPYNDVKLSCDQPSSSNDLITQTESMEIISCDALNSISNSSEDPSSENHFDIKERTCTTPPTTALNKLSLNQPTIQGNNGQLTSTKGLSVLPLNTTKKPHSLPELKVNFCLTCGKPAIYASECCHLVHFCNHLCLYEGWIRHQNTCPGSPLNPPYSSNDFDSISEYQSPSRSLDNLECNDDRVTKNLRINQLVKKPQSSQICPSSSVLTCSTASSSNQKIATRYKLVNLNQGKNNVRNNGAHLESPLKMMSTALNDHHKRVQSLAAELNTTDKPPTPTRYFHYVENSLDNDTNYKSHGQLEDSTFFPKDKVTINGTSKPLQIFELPNWSESQVKDLELEWD